MQQWRQQSQVQINSQFWSDFDHFRETNKPKKGSTRSDEKLTAHIRSRTTNKVGGNQAV